MLGKSKHSVFASPSPAPMLYSVCSSPSLCKEQGEEQGQGEEAKHRRHQIKLAYFNRESKRVSLPFDPQVFANMGEEYFFLLKPIN